MEVTLAIKSKLRKAMDGSRDTGLFSLGFYTESIKFKYVWGVEVRPVVVNVTDKNKYSDKMDQALGNVGLG